jgi:hypothetical protein
MNGHARSSTGTAAWRNAPIINPRQLGGIEAAVLDEPPGRGVRVAWVNTGSGLRYKVVLDRGLDIVDADFAGQSLTWLSANGTKAPDPAYCRGMDWLSAFPGGLLTSCGPLNTGAPSQDDGREWPLHGTHSHTPAQDVVVTNPDPRAGQLDMTIRGLVRTSRFFGPHIDLHRTIRSRLGENVIAIEDVFTNVDDQPVEMAWLLHINFGYPLLEPGASQFCYAGTVQPRSDSREWFATGRPFKNVPAPQPEHKGRGEAFAYIDPAVPRSGRVVCGVVNRRRKLALSVRYNKQEFPRLGNWQHWGPRGAYVAALEPMTAGVEGRHIDRQRGWLIRLRPGQQKRFAYEIAVSGEKTAMQELLALNQRPTEVVASGM